MRKVEELGRGSTGKSDRKCWRGVQEPAHVGRHSVVGLDKSFEFYFQQCDGP